MERTEYDIYKKAMGHCVRRLRRAHKWSIRELALVARLDYKHLHQFEHGEVNITVRTLFRIADALGTTPSELLAETEASLKTQRSTVVTYEMFEPNRARRQ